MKRFQKPAMAAMVVHRSTGCRLVGLPLLFILLCMFTVIGRSPAHAEDKRAEARISIFSDVADPTSADEISIRLMKSRNEDLLTEIVQALGLKFGAQPTNIQYTVGDPDFPDDKSVAITCNLPIVPRGQGYLPLSQFIETLAPYASRVRIVYDIKGSFVYRGYITPYTGRDFSFTVDTPPVISPDVTEAFYAYDINITSSSISNAELPDYPGQGNSSGIAKYSRIALAIGTAIVIIALGLLLALFLPRKKVEPTGDSDSSDKNDNQTGGEHD